MKRLTGIICALCFLSLFAFGQTQEVGVGIGISNFLGDLGKKVPHGNTYYGDLEASLFRSAVTVFYRNHFNYRFSLKIGLTYARFEGDDKLAKSEEFMDDPWFRNYRNLHFRSDAFELAATTEFNILKYVPGSRRYWITPYVFAGVGMIYSNPKAEYNGKWVALQPLGTEGQGMAEYPDRKKYSRLQPVIPIGFGLKCNVTNFLALGLEIGHRFTFTDYLDDVSTTYVSKDEFTKYYGAERGTEIYEISRRSPEIDPEESYGYITKPGEVRGNPGNNDAYLFTTVSLTYKFANNFSEFSFSHKRNTTRKHTARKKHVKKLRRFINNRTW